MEPRLPYTSKHQVVFGCLWGSVFCNIGHKHVTAQQNVMSCVDWISYLIPTFMRFSSCRYWDMDLAIVSKKNQEYCRKEQKTSCYASFLGTWWEFMSKESWKVKYSTSSYTFEDFSPETGGTNRHNHLLPFLGRCTTCCWKLVLQVDWQELQYVQGRVRTLSSLLLVLKSAVCLRTAVTAVASTSWVVTELPDAGLLVTNTYWEEKEGKKRFNL